MIKFFKKHKRKFNVCGCLFLVIVAISQHDYSEAVAWFGCTLYAYSDKD